MRSLMNTDYILRLERGQNEQKSILWMRSEEHTSELQSHA